MVQLTKTGNIYQMTTDYTTGPYNVPNVCKIPRPNGHKICQTLPLQDNKKLTEIGIFVNIPSGNPALHDDPMQ
jgi:hypothetical protein